MRASKEQAERALHTAQRIRNGQSVSDDRAAELVSFLEAAKRKLPTEAAYAKDRQRVRA